MRSRPIEIQIRSLSTDGRGIRVLTVNDTKQRRQARSLGMAPRQNALSASAASKSEHRAAVENVICADNESCSI